MGLGEPLAATRCFSMVLETAANRKRQVLAEGLHQTKKITFPSFWGDNLKIEMRDQKHLWVTVNPGQGDPREIIVDVDKDVRICDGHHVVKVRFKDQKILDILVDDVFVCSKDTWPPLIR